MVRERFNALPRETAEAELLACCASHRWARTVADGRPYADDAQLFAVANTAAEALDWADVEEALNAHPRIGDRPAGASLDSEWSRGEQSGVGDGDRDALKAGNAAYEERFGHVFLICASGRDSAEMLAELNARLGNDAAAERRVVHRELVKITNLRLRKLIG